MVTVDFLNVTISMEADNPKEAYAKLCEILQGVEYGTHTYTVGETIEEQAKFGIHPTTELWPSLE